MQIGSHLFAEGFETAEDLETLVGLDGEDAQGYDLGAPATFPDSRGVTELHATPAGESRVTQLIPSARMCSKMDHPRTNTRQGTVGDARRVLRGAPVLPRETSWC